MQLAALCEAYWFPLYAYVRHRVPNVHEAQDLTQAFFAELLEKNYLGPARPKRGRFRAYLLACFKHFLSNQWQKAKARKRGGGKALLSLDFTFGDSRLRIEPSTQVTPEELYERQWAIAMLERVMGRLRREEAKAGKAERFDLLKVFLVGEQQGETYVDLAAQLDTTAAAAKMAASRLRRRYRQLLREEIAQHGRHPGRG